MSAPKNPPLFMDFDGRYGSDIGLRDLFAAAALALAGRVGTGDSVDGVAATAYEFADAMLKERAK